MATSSGPARAGTPAAPDRPLAPFIERGRARPDILRAGQRAPGAAVEEAHGGKRTITWYEV
ncbi:hypothetical protein [Sorangium sp. So ce1024]|uniref:hypothetical protein n=1 Tax=Sorangium sp. So ce1024 TaxID=3133327 RepID=UPI003F059966